MWVSTDLDHSEKRTWKEQKMQISNRWLLLFVFQAQVQIISISRFLSENNWGWSQRYDLEGMKLGIYGEETLDFWLLKWPAQTQSFLQRMKESK